MEIDFEKLCETYAKHASVNPQWALAYANLLIAKSLDEWLQGAVAELARIADAMGTEQ